MWQLIKSEFRYNWISFVILAFFIISFPLIKVIVLIQFPKLHYIISPNIFGGFYSLIIVSSIYSMWAKRFDEKRERFFSIIPISIKKIAIARFWLAVIPFTMFIFYFLTIQLIISKTLNSEAISSIYQVGIIFTIFTTLILARDYWLLRWDFEKKAQNVFDTFFILIILFTVGFTSHPATLEKYIMVFAEFYGLLFFPLGLGIMVITIFSYQKRNSYLS